MRALAGTLTILLAALQSVDTKTATLEPSAPRSRASGAFAPLARPLHHEAPSAFVDGALLFTRGSASFSTSSVRRAVLRGGVWREDGPAPFAADGEGAAAVRAGAVVYDAGASLSADGKRLYFTSKRKATGFADEWNIWVAERRSARAEGGGDTAGAPSWGEPHALPAPINSDKSDCCLTARASNAVYFSSERDGSWDIFRAAPRNGGGWTVERLPDGVNTPKHMEWPSWVDAEERFLIFSSIRPGGLGGDDLYVAIRGRDGWGEPRNLGPRVNTAGYEDSGLLSPDGRSFLWASRPPKGDSDIHEIAVEELGIPELARGK